MNYVDGIYQKPYDKIASKENDPIAKQTAAMFLTQTAACEVRIPITEQAEAYSIKDFDIYLDNELLSIEVEVKHNWKLIGKWQGYPTIDVPFRKRKSKASIYILFNTHLNTLAMATMSDIQLSPHSSKPCWNTTEPDWFYNVELDKFKFFEDQNGIWKRISGLRYD
jgi:hypothetical protein